MSTPTPTPTPTSPVSPASPATTGSGTRISTTDAVRVIARREIMVRLRSKAFVISSLVFLVAIFATVLLSSIGPRLFEGSDTRVAVTDGAVATVEQLDGVEVTSVATVAEAEQLVASGEVEAAVTGSESEGWTVIGERDVPQGVVTGLSISPQVQLLDPDAPNPALTYAIGLGFGLVFFMSAITYGTTIAQSVVEEKQTRIVEILLAAVPARALLAGKVIGNSLLAFAQIALVAVIVIGTSAATGNAVLLDGLGLPLVAFVVFFTVGFVMLAALYAATAALVSRSEDMGSATSPIMMLVMIPYFLVIFFNNNETVLAVMSYVPFSAPVAVPMRLFLGTTQWWEPVLSLVVLVVTTVVAIRVAALIYSRSLLRTGARVKIGDVLRSGS